MDSFRNIIRDLFDTMDAMNGAGLAAPQIGVPLRLFAKGMQFNPRYPDAPPVPREVVINPRVQIQGKEELEFWEGCLSVPGMRGLVRRPANIKATYYDQSGRYQRRDLKGFEAVVFQHELDHLDGMLFVDRLVDTKLFGFTENFE